MISQNFVAFSENLKFTYDKNVLMSQNKLFNVYIRWNWDIVNKKLVDFSQDRYCILISVTEICDFQIFFWGTDTCLPSQLNLVTFVPGLFWISCQWLFYSVVLVLTTDSKEACRKIQLTWKIRLILQNKRRIFESMKVSLPSFLSLLLLFWEVRWHAGYGKHVSIDGNFSRGAF